MLRQRLLTAAFGIPLGLLLIYVGGWYLAGAVALLAVGGLRELYRLMRATGRVPYAWLGYSLAVLLVVAIAASSSREARSLSLEIEAAVLTAAVATAAVWMLSATPKVRSLRLFATLAGHMYVPQLLSYVLRLRGLSALPIQVRGLGLAVPAGLCWLMLVMVTVWGMDTAAYGVGRAIGRMKLCPKISPGKTVEGSVAGLLLAILLTAGPGYWLGLPLVYGLILGLALGVLGQLGDLFESMLKRSAGVKDSGSLLPGHGGVLDRFDSLLFAAPLAYFYLSFVL